MTEPISETAAATARTQPQALENPDQGGQPASTPPLGRRRPKRRPPRKPEAGDAPDRARPPRSHPLLEQLATLYPQLFGATFRPLKRGIFQDLLAAHPEVFERDGLKVALALHTRSSRYLQAVAAGLQRHDLQGQAVEAMAPEHVHHALLEVFRRRHGRTGEDLRPQLRLRIIQAFEASGLSREAYAERVRSRDEAANTVLDEAMAELAARAAKDEALLRAFEYSGQSEDAFASMYGIAPGAAASALERARRARPAAAA